MGWGNFKSNVPFMQCICLNIPSTQFQEQRCNLQTVLCFSLFLHETYRQECGNKNSICSGRVFEDRPLKSTRYLSSAAESASALGMWPGPGQRDPQNAGLLPFISRCKLLYFMSPGPLLLFFQICPPFPFPFLLHRANPTRSKGAPRKSEPKKYL